MKTTVAFFLSLALAPAIANADRTSDIDAALHEFDVDPVTAMNRLPLKVNALTGEPIQARSAFSDEQIAEGGFIDAKDSYRQNLCTTVHGARVCLGDILPGRAPFEQNDLAEDLADNGETLERNLKAMESKKLMSAALDESPWSDTYWPIYEGQLAARYADSDFPKSSSWLRNFNYSEEHDLSKLFHSAKPAELDEISPAEKYDLLVGDLNGALTASNWNEGESYYRSSHKVESWMGICHGWAPASYMVPRPKHEIQVMAADGKTEINFYPSDVKGLASLLWAKNKNETRFIGGRCNDKRPATDRNGRVTSQECFDTNPGTWHLAIVNQIGISKRSFVIDATYDYEVWNQPVYSYSYTYFNPETRKSVKSLEEATTKISDFDKDRFSKYRSKDAVAVVGIAMDLTYIQETDPSHAKTDAPANDSPSKVRYMYDLELNSRGEIIGGEWYENAHPDFLWTPGPNDGVETSGDAFAKGDWDGKGAMPDSWQRAAAATSKSEGSPLSKIVGVLSHLAHGAARE